jgi:hypothetical protein
MCQKLDPWASGRGESWFWKMGCWALLKSLNHQCVVPARFQPLGTRHLLDVSPHLGIIHHFYHRARHLHMCAGRRAGSAVISSMLQIVILHPDPPHLALVRCAPAPAHAPRLRYATLRCRRTQSHRKQQVMSEHRSHKARVNILCYIVDQDTLGSSCLVSQVACTAKKPQHAIERFEIQSGFERIALLS